MCVPTLNLYYHGDYLCSMYLCETEKENICYLKKNSVYSCEIKKLDMASYN